MQDYLIPFEFTGICRIKAVSPEAARDMFDAMRPSELIGHAEFWADDRTFTPAEYEAAIKAVVEGPEEKEEAPARA